MRQEKVEYQVEGRKHIGVVAYDDAISGTRPAVLVAHAWRGRDDFAVNKAVELAKLGYVGFAADMFSEAKTATTDEEAFNLILPLFLDRTKLRKVVNAGLETMKTLPAVDKSRTGAIGFCFGGLTVMELLRSGADVRGVVSFHGVLGNKLGDHEAKLIPDKKMKGAILFLHGNDDPMVSQQDIVNIEKEFTQGNVDWQIHIYGHAVHAFTNPEAHNRAAGMEFDQRAERRSWQAMRNFFDEKFQ
jgi:dienelactone hydrolase